MHYESWDRLQKIPESELCVVGASEKRTEYGRYFKKMLLFFNDNFFFLIIWVRYFINTDPFTIQIYSSDYIRWALIS